MEHDLGSMTAIRLPYDFDTVAVWRTILKGMFGLQLVIVPGILYSIFVSKDLVAATGLLAIGVVWAGFTRIFVKNLDGCTGTLDADEIVVKPGDLYGFRLPGPQGRFPLHQFSGVLVKESLGPIQPGVQGGPHEKIYLIGKDGTPDILIARTERRTGAALGREFGTLLGLRCEVQLA